MEADKQKPALSETQSQSTISNRLESMRRLRKRITVPLSPAQKRIWILQQLEPESPAYNRPLAVRLTGKLNTSALSRSLSEIAKRHEALCSVFPMHSGEPVQVINPPHRVKLQIIDLQHHDRASREIEAKRLAAAQVQQVFSLEHGPLFRAVLLRMSKDDHILMLLMHHIVFDGWSETVLLRELSTLYDAISSGHTAALPELPLQYSQFILWQQEQVGKADFKKSLRYWERQLEGVDSACFLPTGQARKHFLNFRGNRLDFWLDSAFSESLRQFSRRERVTLFMTLLAAFQIVLRRYAGKDDIVLGVPIAGRTHLETEGMIGCFMNVLVLRTDLSGKPTFRELLWRVRDVALDAYAHQDVPFDKIVEILRPARDLKRWPLFQVMFHLRNLPHVKAVKAGDLNIAPFLFETGMIGGLELSLEIQDGSNGLHCVLAYASDIENTTNERIAKQFRLVLETVIADPNCPIDTLSVLTEQELHKLVIDWNLTERQYPRDKCIHQLFEEQVARSPYAVAVAFENRSLTYLELNTRANRLANHLIRLGVGPDMMVAICLERSLEMLIGLLAILKAGGAYVPLDPSYPKEHLAYIVQDAQPSIILAQSLFLKDVCEPGTRVISLDVDLEALLANETTQNPHNRAEPDNLAYIIYTSGSTGRPKGVMVCHRGVCNYLQWRRDYFPLTEEDRLLQKASFSFDDSVWEFFEPLMVGAQLVLTTPGGERDAGYLVRVINEQKITAVSFVPAMLGVFLREAEINKCETLRRVTTGGESLPIDLQERFFKVLEADLYNGYGPTEATIAATFWRCKKTSQQSIVPIGRPIANTQIYLLDSQLEPVPIGVPGELHIGGFGLARGYLHRADLTAARFIPNPFDTVSGARLYKTGDIARYRPDGNIEFLGRMDDQVKIRGHRVELGEIEAVLRQHPGIENLAVMVRADELEAKHLVAYFVSRPEVMINERDLRDYLKKKLPQYMVPSRFIALNELPITSNGKLDRKALLQHDRGRSMTHEIIVAPQTPTEEALVRIWAEVLGTDQVGVTDNFFDLGGHSLSATQLLSRLQQDFTGKFTLRMLFDHPTIGELAEQIAEAQVLSATQLEVVGLLADVEEMSDEDAKRLIGEQPDKKSSQE